MMHKYLQKLGISKEIKEGFYRLQDPYHGVIEFFLAREFNLGHFES